MQVKEENKIFPFNRFAYFFTPFAARRGGFGSLFCFHTLKSVDAEAAGD
jgi:hypothetical protein